MGCTSIGSGGHSTRVRVGLEVSVLAIILDRLLLTGSVSRRVGELGCRKPGPIICSVVSMVEPLEERHPVDEVKALAARGAQTVDNQVDGARGAPYGRVELFHSEM